MSAGVVFALWTFWRHDHPKPAHRAWPDDVAAGRGLELRQWGALSGGPNEERKGWRKFLAWFKK